MDTNQKNQQAFQFMRSKSSGYKDLQAMFPNHVIKTTPLFDELMEPNENKLYSDHERPYSYFNEVLPFHSNEELMGSIGAKRYIHFPEEIWATLAHISKEFDTFLKIPQEKKETNLILGVCRIPSLSFSSLLINVEHEIEKGKPTLEFRAYPSDQNHSDHDVYGALSSLD